MSRTANDRGARVRVLAVSLVVASACGGGAGGVGPPLELCAVCEADAQCESGLCRMYGDGFRKCSLPCTAGQPAPECASPALGGCNNMGFCTCAPLPMPADADIDDGGFKDASTL